MSVVHSIGQLTVTALDLTLPSGNSGSRVRLRSVTCGPNAQTANPLLSSAGLPVAGGAEADRTDQHRRSSGDDGPRHPRMSDPFAVAGTDYLEQLLRAAIRVPAAASDPAGGRVVASLMVALVAKGEDERIEPYLSCSPGRRSVYEVTCYDEAGRPASLVTGLAAGQAIRAAARFAAARTDRTVTVVARDDIGHERCVLVGQGPA
ncbi:MAG: hypothetical protein M3Y04_04085, partial [Actinomycetota bacterium]|nr:hypothetical protein [Actinomycetota bacterium]